MKFGSVFFVQIMRSLLSVIPYYLSAHWTFPIRTFTINYGFFFFCFFRLCLKSFSLKCNRQKVLAEKTELAAKDFTSYISHYCYLLFLSLLKEAFLFSFNFRGKSTVRKEKNIKKIHFDVLRSSKLKC